MTTARLTSQIVAKIPSRVGLLADVTEAVREAGVNITAVSAYERDGVGKFLLVTSDNTKAVQALGRLNADVDEKSVLAVEMPNEPGALEAVTRAIAEANINIEYAYGTAQGGGTSIVIIRTEDDVKAADLF